MVGRTQAMSKTESFLEQELLLQGNVLGQVLDRTAEVQQVMRACIEDSSVDWIVTGCGDSLFAGMCAEVWFAAAAGVPLRAIHALHFSRYLYRSAGPHSVVFAVSYSGNTARVIEAAIAAKSRGATVVGVTTNAKSRLVELCDHWLPNDATDERSNCRTGSFQAACLLFRLAASVLADAKRRAPMPDPRGIAQTVTDYAVNCQPIIQHIVASLGEGLTFTVIGGGYCYPIACYGAAKLYEAATIPAHAVELEQFVHCEIFPVTAGSLVVITAPQGASYSRAVEVADGLSELGAATIGISDSADFANHCTHFSALPEGWHESLSPFLACVPLQFLALYEAVRRGDNPDLVSNKWVNRPLIERSEQWIASDYSAKETV